MNLGIAGRRAIVCGGSKGLGRACALALAREGAAVTLGARPEATPAGTPQAVRAGTRAEVGIVPADVTSAGGRAAALRACPAPDILVTNPGVRQTPADFRALPHEDWLYWMEAHFFSALELIRAVVPGMTERRFGRIV